MLISIRGRHCSDDCPFYTFNMLVDNGVEIEAPRCGLSGHKDYDGDVIDIRLALRGKSPDQYCPRPANCPFCRPAGERSVEVMLCG
jgi:hypothetical protein